MNNSNFRRNNSRNRAKSKLFQTTFILCVVFGGALFFVSRSYIRHLRAESTPIGKGKSSARLPGRVHLDSIENTLYVGEGKERCVLTMDPKLQEIAEKLLENFDPVVGGFILMDAKTGEMKVMAAHTRKRKQLPAYERYQTCMDPLLRSSIHPMASIAKLVTASAALELKKVGPRDGFNCSGSFHVEGEGTITDPKGVAHGGINMERALHTSCNPTFARIGIKVGRNNLQDYFDRFMFNAPISFDLPVEESGASIADGVYNIGRAGSGFDGSWMSPLHAVMIAATFQMDGVMMRPHMIKSCGRNGLNTYKAAQKIIARPISEKTARTITEMMSGTVNTPGSTAYRGFYKGGRPVAPGMRFVGKTGSINGNTDAEFYTWFIGHANKDGHKYAFATMIVNDGNWKIKAASYTGQFFNRAASKIE